jgi:hypothetical protein
MGPIAQTSARRHRERIDDRRVRSRRECVDNTYARIDRRVGRVDDAERRVAPGDEPQRVAH